MTLSTVEQYDPGVDVDAEVAALTRRIAADGPRAAFGGGGAGRGGGA
ncbi:hypothetical protein ACFHWS_28190 [Micromonospora sp. LOL_013]